MDRRGGNGNDSKKNKNKNKKITDKNYKWQEVVESHNPITFRRDTAHNIRRILIDMITT